MNMNRQSLAVLLVLALAATTASALPGGIPNPAGGLLPIDLDVIEGDVGTSTGFMGPGPYIIGLHALEREVQIGDEFYGHVIVGVNHAIRFIVINVEDPESLASQLDADTNVRYIQHDGLDFHASFVPSEVYYNCCQWGIKDVNVETAWDTTLGSTSVRLAILDSGLRKSHEDIGNYLQGYDFVFNDNDPNDNNGHGTHVTSTAAGLTNNGLGVAGVAQAEILPVRVLNAQGSGTHSQIANGVTYAADQGSDILSMSLGGPSGSQTMLDAINYAWNSGAIVIAASGNDNGPVGYPAAYSNAMAVGAYDQNHNRASFSNFGSQLEISAPGVQIAAAYNRNDADYVYQDGTSMATPIVSGVAALALTVDPTLTNTELRQLLRDTAVDYGAAGWDSSFGYGGVDAAAAVAAAQSGGGGGGGGPTTVYSEDFEASTNFVKSSGSSDLWRITSGCLGGNGGSSLQFNEAGDCQYSTGAQVTGWARTEVDLSGETTADLSFDHKWNTESYSGGAYDIMRVQISADNSAWTTLQQWDSRNPNQATWTTANYNIDAWAGDSTVWIRFFFDSIDGSFNNYSGWAVDNFLVTKG